MYTTQRFVSPQLSDVDMYVAAYGFLVLPLSGLENDRPEPLEMIFKVEITKLTGV
jgi:hypothetical protein